MPLPLPTLPDDVIEQIFLSIRLHEPASLRRAEVANKFWHGLLTGTAFRGRYRERHGNPPKVRRGRPCKPPWIRTKFQGRTKEFYQARARREMEAEASSRGISPLVMMLEDLQRADAVNNGGSQPPPSSKRQKTTKHVGVKQATSRSTLTNAAAQPKITKHVEVEQATSSSTRDCQEVTREVWEAAVRSRKMIKNSKVAMAAKSGQGSTRGQQGPPSSNHQLQLKKMTKHVEVKQAPSPSTLTNVAAQPVSHNSGNAALRNVVNTNGNRVDEKTRKLDESAKKQIDVKAKVPRIDAQS